MKPALPPTFATFFGTVHNNHPAGRVRTEGSLGGSFELPSTRRFESSVEAGTGESPRPRSSPSHRAADLSVTSTPQPPPLMPTTSAFVHRQSPCRPVEGAHTVEVLVDKPSPTKTRRYAHRLHAVPPSPLRPFVKAVFMASEIPFLILMTYAIYWFEICYLAAAKAPTTVWLNALVAGVLVGIGLNANAYRALYRPMSRERKRQAEKRKGIESGRFIESISPMSCGGLSTRSMRICAFVSSAHLPLKWSEDDTEFDLGMMVRFFIIPFAVSSLSGITNHAREEFLLVFPRDETTLLIFILLPTMAVVTLMAMRLYFILTIPLRPFWKAIFLNGKILL